MSSFSVEFKRFLERSGVSPDSTVIIHSGISDLTKVGFDPWEFCELISVFLSNGTIIMPTMTWKTVTPQNPVFDVRNSPSHTGMLTEAFRTNFASHRSLHPTHSVAAVGERAAFFLGQHHLSGTPCSKNSPYGLIANSNHIENTYVVFINVGFESCTFIHFFEEETAINIYLKSEEEQYELISFDGASLPFRLRRHKSTPRNFQQIGHWLAAKGRLSVTTSDNGISLICAKAADIALCVRQKLATSQLSLLSGHSYDGGWIELGNGLFR